VLSRIKSDEALKIIPVLVLTMSDAPADVMNSYLADKKLFSRLLESVKQADEIVRGERAPAREFVVNAAQIRAVGAATGLSQSQFARLIEVNVGTLRNWEQGLRTPTGPARALLKALKNRPAEVVKALQAA
jgi:putative transcriptional regulator